VINILNTPIDNNAINAKNNIFLFTTSPSIRKSARASSKRFQTKLTIPPTSDKKTIRDIPNTIRPLAPVSLQQNTAEKITVTTKSKSVTKGRSISTHTDEISAPKSAATSSRLFSALLCESIAAK
jgi:hypothetical protein